jgi:hypothetical protein
MSLSFQIAQLFREWRANKTIPLFSESNSEIITITPELGPLHASIGTVAVIEQISKQITPSALAFSAARDDALGPISDWTVLYILTLLG